MKNVFFSIMVLFMLAVTPLGYVDMAKADSDNILVGDRSYSPLIAIKGVNQFVDVTFTVTNIDPATDLDLSFDVTSPVLGENSLITADPADIPLAANGGNSQVTFRVTGINLNTVEGIYSGTITVTDTADANNNRAVSYQVSVQNSRPSVSITSGLSNEEFVLTGEEDTTPQSTFVIKNNGNRDLNDLQLVFPNGGEFEDSSGNEISFRVKIGNADFAVVDLAQPVDIGALTVNQELTIIVRAIIPSDISLNNYDGDVLVRSVQYADLATGLTDDLFGLIVKVEPEICKDGRVSDKAPLTNEGEGNVRIAHLDVEEDQLNVGETLQLSVDVENKDNNNMDITIEAMLYNLDDNRKLVGWEEIGSENIDENGEESFDYDLEIPMDDDRINPGDTYILYVKAYEDGREGDNCNYDSISIEIDREDDDVVVTRFTMTPSVISPGEKLLFNVDVLSIGNDKQDEVYITLTNAALGLDLESTKFELDQYSKSKNSMSKSFEFTVPANIEANDYLIEARVYFRDGRESKYTTGTLAVQGEAVVEQPEVQPPEINPPTNQPSSGTYTPTGGSIFDNIGSTKTLFVIGDIVLVILAVLFLVLIFKKR